MAGTVGAIHRTILSNACADRERARSRIRSPFIFAFLATRPAILALSRRFTRERRRGVDRRSARRPRANGEPEIGGTDRPPRPADSRRAIHRSFGANTHLTEGRYKNESEIYLSNNAKQLLLYKDVSHSEASRTFILQRTPRVHRYSSSKRHLSPGQLRSLSPRSAEFSSQIIAESRFRCMQFASDFQNGTLFVRNRIPC